MNKEVGVQTTRICLRATGLQNLILQQRKRLRIIKKRSSVKRPRVRRREMRHQHHCG